jgi:carboxylesterase type B
MFAAIAISTLSATAAPAFAAERHAVPVFSPKVPETAAEHQQAADDYKAKAKSHRAEAAMHRSMAEMYQARIKGPASNRPNPWLINMVKHCKELATKLGETAVTEEAAAEVHAAQSKAAAAPRN